MSLSHYNAGLTYNSGIRYADGALVFVERIIMARIRLPFTGLALDPMIAALQHIVASMDGKPAFASLQAQVTALQAKLTALVAKKVAQKTAEDDAKQFLIEREQLADEAVALATMLGSGVENVAQGNGAVMVDAGYAVRTAPVPGGPLLAPANLRATMSELTGVINLRWRSVERAASYVAERATDPNGPWTQIGLPVRVTFAATGLVSGTKYYFRVAGIGPDGPGPWSDIAEKMAP